MCVGGVVSLPSTYVPYLIHLMVELHNMVDIDCASEENGKSMQENANAEGAEPRSTS